MMYTAIGKPVQFYIQSVFHMHGLCDRNKKWTEFLKKSLFWIKFAARLRKKCQRIENTEMKIWKIRYGWVEKMENTKNWGKN